MLDAKNALELSRLSRRNDRFSAIYAAAFDCELWGEMRQVTYAKKTAGRNFMPFPTDCPAQLPSPQIRDGLEREAERKIFDQIRSGCTTLNFGLLCPDSAANFFAPRRLVYVSTTSICCEDLKLVGTHKELVDAFNWLLFVLGRLGYAGKYSVESAFQGETAICQAYIAWTGEKDA